MRKNHVSWLVAVLSLGVVACALLLSGCTSLFGPEGLPLTEQPELNTMAKKPGCTTIQDGTLVDSAGNIIVVGYDKWGYNYQAHMFNGWYWNSSRPDVPWTKETLEAAGKSTTWLIMKWNDAWLSNKDCDGDGLLDRHYGFDSYIGSGAWCTNHQSGEYTNDAGEICKWNYFVKIVAAPADAQVNAGIWYAANGAEIGPVIWGSFAIVQEVENDACAGIHGLLDKAARPGLGNW